MTKRKNIWIVLDNEGPCTLNDNAQESMVALAEQCGLGKEVGIRFYRNISNIDDIWGDYNRLSIDSTYSSGHTLKVVLPFFKATGATQSWLYEFAKENLRVVPHIDKTLQSLSEKYNTWMISTSYNFFIKAFCDQTGFDFSRVNCTKVEKFDQIPISISQKTMLLEFIQEVANMPVIEYDRTTGIVISEHQGFYARITEFIWNTIYNLPVGEFLRIVHPVGQTQKREALEQVCQKFNVSLNNVMYVGDSQTDVQCVELLTGEGLTMMFNGKGRVFHISDVIHIGEDGRAIEEVADLFADGGRFGVLNTLLPSQASKHGGVVAKVPADKTLAKALEEQSIQKRKEFRGVHIGDLT